MAQGPPRGGAFCRAGWATLGSQRLWWARMRAVCDAEAWASLHELGAALLDGVQKSQPSVAVDSSALPSMLL